MILDFHTHIYPPQVATKVISNLTRYPINVYADGTLDGLKLQMLQNGIDRAVLLPVATKPSQVADCNAFLEPYLDDALYPQFTPFCTVHPDHPDPIGVLRQAHAKGFKGVKLHPIMQCFHPQERRLMPLYRAIEEEGMIVLFHAGAGMDFDDIYGSKDDFDRYYDMFPYPRTVLAHLGGRPNFQEFPAFKGDWPGYIDTALSPGMMPDDYLVALCRDYGASRVLFGSDSPWADPSEYLTILKHSGFSSAELEAILYANAEDLLAQVR